MNEPLWLPRGSVRAIIALGTVGVLVYKVALGQAADVPEWFQLFATAAGGGYFGSRVLESRRQQQSPPADLDAADLLAQQRSIKP